MTKENSTLTQASPSFGGPTHEKKVSLYKNLTTPYGVLPLRRIIEIIKSDEYVIAQNLILDLLLKGEKDRANAIKKHLPAFTASCQCSTWRCLENVSIYTSYLALDLDGIPLAEMGHLMNLIAHDKYVMAAFRSPSWRGIKFIIETDAPIQNHKMAYDQAAAYFEQLLGKKLDRSGSDICRLCFFSHDPMAFYRDAHEIFHLSPVPPDTNPSKPRFPIRPLTSLCTEMNDYLFRKSLRMTNRKRQYYEGNRNNYIFLLSCYCRMNGLSKEDTLEEILRAFNYSQREITAAVKSAYRYK